MQKKWFECKVKYRKTDENGNQKITTNSYLVDAVSFTEAETIIHECMLQTLGEEFKVTNIRTTNYVEVNPFEDCEKWFKAKVSLLAYDEESGKERKTNMYLLVQSNDAKQAYENTVLAMKNTMGEYSIPSVCETDIIDVFQYHDQN